MCGCARPAGNPRPIRSTTVVSRNNPRDTVIPIVIPQNNTIQAMDPERLRIEQFHREAIRRSFGNLSR